MADVEIAKELCPDEIFGPEVLLVRDKAPKVACQLLVGPLHLSIGLSVALI